MTLDQLRAMCAEMLAANKAYKKAEPDVVHIAHAELKAKRFAFNRASGEYVAGLLDQQNPIPPVIIVRGQKK